MHIWILSLILSVTCWMQAVGPYQVIVIPSAEATQTHDGIQILNSQGQMRAAYLVGFSLSSQLGPVIINKQLYPLGDMFIVDKQRSFSSLQTIAPLFHEANYTSIKSSGQLLSL